jgi:hypothetical protein
MQRLYFNFTTGDVRLVPDATCPPMTEETSFPNAVVPDDVTMDMVSFVFKNGLLQPDIKYPSIQTTTSAAATAASTVPAPSPTGATNASA